VFNIYTIYVFVLLINNY